MRAKYLNTNQRQEPKEISDVLGEIIEGVAIGVDVRHGGLVEHWTTLTTAELATADWAMATPIGVRDEVLLVEVPDGTTASLLRYQLGPMLDAISDAFGPDVVQAIRLRVARN